jgi:hypothetical protein
MLGVAIKDSAVESRELGPYDRLAQRYDDRLTPEAIDDVLGTLGGLIPKVVHYGPHGRPVFVRGFSCDPEGTLSDFRVQYVRTPGGPVEEESVPMFLKLYRRREPPRRFYTHIM